MQRSLHGMGGLGDTTITNPYPNGINVAHTGPNNSAANFPLAYYPALGVWVAGIGGGIAPVYTTAQWPTLLDGNVFAHGTGIWAFGMKGGHGEFFLGRQPSSLAPGAPTFWTNPNKSTSSQNYTYDSGTGYWIPSYAQSWGAPGSNLWQDLLIAGVIIAAVVITAGAAGAFAAPAAAAGGATAAGGTAAAATTATVATTGAAAAGAGAAGAAGLSVSTVTGFISAAATAATTVAKIAAGTPATAAPAVAAPTPPGTVVAAGTTLIAPNGTTVTTSTAGAVPAGYSIAQTPAVVQQPIISGAQGTQVPAGTTLIAPDGSMVQTTTAGAIPAGYAIAQAGSMPAGYTSISSPVVGGTPFSIPGATTYPSPAPATAGTTGAGLPSWAAPAAMGAALVFALAMPMREKR